MKALQNKKFYGKMECLSLWCTYISEKGKTLGKTFGIKARCDWEHPWGTHWKPVGNKRKILRILVFRPSPIKKTLKKITRHLTAS